MAAACAAVLAAAWAAAALAGRSAAAVRAAVEPAVPARPYSVAARGPRRVPSIVNSIRSHVCEGRGRLLQPLRERAQLNAAAQRLAAGAGLREATESAGYRATSSISIHISGDLSDAAVARVLSSRFCPQLTTPGLRDVGFYRQGSDLWILAAAPFATPALSSPAAVDREVLDLVNAARAAGRRCGRRVFGPAPPLHLSARLREAALVHSRDMAAHSYLDHIGRDGSTPADRVTRTGYLWRLAGENVAAGPTSAREAADGWLASPEHCANIMDPGFTDTAVAYAIDRKSRAGVYWTEVFAAPRRAAGRGRR